MKYQTLDRILKKKADYNLIMAGRDTGKSTAMTKHLIDEYKKYGRKFIRLFRKRGNSFNSADSWFDEYKAGGKFETGDDFTFDGENYYINGDLFGATAIISMAGTYRSKVYDPRIYHAVFDEYIGVTMDEYVEEEVKKFLSILTTCFRHRERKVWLLGNNYNDCSKHNPYHLYFGIDIDRDKLKQGDIKVYKSKRFKDPATIAFEFGRIAYENETEIPKAERLDGNEVATTGNFGKVWDVFDQKERYPNPVSFLRDSIDNYFIADTFNRCYFAVINDEMQCIDWITTTDDLTQIGKSGNLDEYRALIEYREYFINLYGETDYEAAVMGAMPYEITYPLYCDGNRYGENCDDFLTGIRRIYRGYTYQYCDSNIKYLFERIVLRGIMQ